MAYEPDHPDVVRRLRSLRDKPPPPVPTPEPPWCLLLVPGAVVEHTGLGTGRMIDQKMSPLGRSGLVRFDAGHQAWFALARSPLRLAVPPG